MNKKMNEEWEFIITVEKTGPCRAGHEAGDVMRCGYGCPDGFCPKTMPTLFSLCEIARCGGSYTYLGSGESYVMLFSCAEDVVRFRLEACRMGI